MDERLRTLLATIHDEAERLLATHELYEVHTYAWLGEHWNTGSASKARLGFGGFVRSAVEREGQSKEEVLYCTLGRALSSGRT